jgi:AraC-like DNA-binding protein
MGVGYRERPARPAALAGAVLWTRGIAGPRAVPVRAQGPGRGPGAAGGGGAAPGSGPPGPPLVLPDGCMDLIWTPGRLFVSGPDTMARPAEGAPNSRWAGIRFAPGTAPALLALGVPARELRDRRVELADLRGGAVARRLIERMDTAADPAAALEELAAGTARRADAPDPRLAEVVRRLAAGSTVAAAAEAVGLGPRLLHRASLDAFGYGPKLLARVLRLGRALDLVREGVPPAEAAARSGCSDQAHLAREMRALTGTTLTAYLRARG